MNFTINKLEVWLSRLAGFPQFVRFFYFLNSLFIFCSPKKSCSFGFAELVIPHPRDSSVLLLAQKSGALPHTPVTFLS